VVDVACGFGFTALVTEDGSLYTFGATSTIGNSESSIRKPLKVQELGDFKVTAVEAGKHHLCVLCE
jgi:alpha-tubulin suppressor-like RCC1 family protein